MSRLIDLFRFKHWRELRALKKQKQFGMTSLGEQHWLRTYAARRYRGDGAIVDLGCFLGATTIALAQGLDLNPKAKRKRIDAYDLFVWGEGFETWAKGREMEGVLTAGASFLPEFLKRTEPWRDYIVVHQEDLSQTRWENGPIEFLFVDAMKNPATANAIASTFFPDLIAGRSYLAHQDFPHAYTPWVHFLAYRLRDHFRWIEEMPQSSLFRLEKKIEPELLGASLEPRAMSPDEIEAAFDHSLSFVSDDKKANVMAAKAMAYVGRGEFGLAREIMIHSPYGPVSRADEFRSVKALIERKLVTSDG